MVRFCRVNGRFVQNNCVFAEIGVKFCVFCKESCRNLSALPHEVLLILRALLVFSGIIANHDEANVAFFGDFIERGIIHDRRFKRILRRVF